jgi:phosphatidylglycerol lysyltransferase
MFDVLAARIVVRDRVSSRLAAFAGAVTQGISNTLGFHAITGTALRYRIYATAGLGAGDIARIVSLAGLGVGLGFAVVIAGALCWQPEITQGWGRWPGLALALLLAAMVAWLVRPRTLALGRLTLPLPGAGATLAQMLIGGVEMLAAISALYVLLPAGAAPPFVDFLPIYVGAVLAGIVSHAPGGLGVFEMPWVTAPANAANLLETRSRTTIRAASTSNIASIARLTVAAATEYATRQAGKCAQAAATSRHDRPVR